MSASIEDYTSTEMNTERLEGLHFIVVTKDTWGIGPTIEDAIRKAGGSGKRLVYATFDQKAYVDGMGNVCTAAPFAGSRLVGALNSATPGKSPTTA